MATKPNPITVAYGAGTATPKQVIAPQERVIGLGLEGAMTENLRNYDGKPGFTLAQGQ
jgi:hypothetical protein